MSFDFGGGGSSYSGSGSGSDLTSGINSSNISPPSDVSSEIRNIETTIRSQPGGENFLRNYSVGSEKPDISKGEVFCGGGPIKKTFDSLAKRVLKSLFGS